MNESAQLSCVISRHIGHAFLQLGDALARHPVDAPSDVLKHVGKQMIADADAGEIREDVADPEPLEDRVDLQEALSAFLDRHGIGQASNTPNMVLADHLIDCIVAFEKVTRARDQNHLNGIHAATARAAAEKAVNPPQIVPLRPGAFFTQGEV